MAGADRRPWFRWLKISSEKRTQGDKAWFVPKASPVQDNKKPENNVTNGPLRVVFEQLRAQLDLDVYFPRVIRSYAGAGGGNSGGGGGGGNDSGGTGSGLKPDVSDGDFGGAPGGL